MPAPASLADVKLTYVDDVESAMRLMTWLGERRPSETLCVDLETGEFPGNDKKDALSPWHGRIRLAQIGDGIHGWAVPWERWAGVFQEAMRKFQGRILIHNAAFDTKWLVLQSEVEIPWERIDDSMIASRICNPTEPAGLKELTSKYVDSMAKYLQHQLHTSMSDNGWTWGTVPVELPAYHLYGALDTVLACRMWEDLGSKVSGSGQFVAPYELEMGVLKVAIQMELNGARIDPDYSQKQYDHLYGYAQSIRDWAKDAYGLNIASPKQMTAWFDTQGAVFEHFTAGGSPKVDKEQLDKFAVAHKGFAAGEMASQILNMRASEKLASSYFKNFIEMNVDGIVHPSINTLAARTGRMSINNPALQTLPKSNKIVRKAFIPRNEDEIIMSCDLEQVEARVFSCLSKDTGLIDLFNFCDSSGEDFFTQIGRQVYADPSMVKADPRRQLLKGVMYGRLYGAGVAKMAVTAGVPEAQMKEVNDSFDVRFPGMKRMMKQIELQGMKRLHEEGQAYVMTKGGRRLPAEDDRIYALVNFLIQGTSAEILKQNILRCDAAGLTPYLLAPVHDELVLSVPKSEQLEIGKTLQECMTTRDGWDVPLLAGAPDVGERWGDLSPLY